MPSLRRRMPAQQVFPGRAAPLRDEPWTDRSKRTRQVRRSWTSPWQFYSASRRITRKAVKNARPCSKESKPNETQRKASHSGYLLRSFTEGKNEQNWKVPPQKRSDRRTRGNDGCTLQVQLTAITCACWLILITFMFCLIFLIGKKIYVIMWPEGKRGEIAKMDANYCFCRKSLKTNEKKCHQFSY